MRLQANFLLKNAAQLCCVTGTKSGFGDNGSSVVHALAKAGIDLRENGNIVPRPKGKAR
jgi:hypothetical protein